MSISKLDFAKLTDQALISDYVAAHNIPHAVAFHRGTFDSYNLPAVTKHLFPATSNPVPIPLLANHVWVAQLDGNWRLERYSTAETFPDPPEGDVEDDDSVPMLNYYPPDGLPVNSSVDLFDEARKLEDGSLALEEERAKTASLMTLVTSICGKAYAEKIMRIVNLVETNDDASDQESGGESGGNIKSSNNFTQKRLQPSPWRAGINKAQFGDLDWATKMKGASDTLIEDVYAVLMPPPKYVIRSVVSTVINVNSFLPRRATNDAGQSDTSEASTSTAKSPRKRPRSSEDEDACTSPKRVKTGVEEGGRAEAQVESSRAAALQRQNRPRLRDDSLDDIHINTSLKGQIIEERFPVDLDEEPLNAATSDSPRFPGDLLIPIFFPKALKNLEDLEMYPPCEAHNPVAPPPRASDSSYSNPGHARHVLRHV
ncbi:uncharacterized protein BT62DRAFT_1014211 [Guyanagaster necrorhizus]|uniref:Uncharacterized protein n=1 Tax=Guyanagaster necrorhizus TaxID=856835 RepID=A0A9P7VEH2_9AGAR|nr:uncharacterized protein BT62DRAFT_1014211 [Guyanagaster necrorhizus MCA 3950]KAG7439224.1 hypothetical protein BT62DRAFT_1014211 [Guyanagaster necrorhizus MCA 3950]